MIVRIRPNFSRIRAAFGIRLRAGISHLRAGFNRVRAFRFHVEHAAFIGMFATAGLIVLGAYWEFWPPRSQVFAYTKPIYVTTPVVVVGSTLTYEMSYRKDSRYADWQAGITTTFVDHAATPLPYMTVGALPSGEKSISINVQVPPLKSGEYRLNVVRDYEFSPIRHELYSSTSNTFRIVEAPADISNKEMLNQINSLFLANQGMEELIKANHILNQKVSDLVEINQKLIEATKAVGKAEADRHTNK